jgi:hypothetical protein
MTDHGKYAGVVDIAVNGVDEVIRLRNQLAMAEAMIARNDALINGLKAELVDAKKLGYEAGIRAAADSFGTEDSGTVASRLRQHILKLLEKES